MKNSFFIFTAICLLLGCKGFTETSTSKEQDNDYAEQYTGFDINLGVGYSGLGVELDFQDPERSFSVKNENVGASGAAVQGKFGGTYGFCNYWIIGLDAYGQYNSEEHKLYHTHSSHTGNHKISIDINLGVDARLGIVADPSNMFYITVGPDWGHLKHSFHSTHENTDFSHSKNEFKLGVKVGIGAEQKFSSNWLIKEQFGYSFYQKTKHHHTDGATSDIKPRLATMIFSLGYLF